MAGRRVLLLAAGAALLVSLLAGRVQAHGKAISIGVTCAIPDPARPLTRRCTAVLKYLDGEPVSRARLIMTAAREGGPTVAAVPFTALDEDGVYSLTVAFPAYGKWRMRVEVLEPGQGAAELQELLLPPLPGTAPELRARLQVVLRLGPADVRNLAVRIVHFLSAASWFALVSLVLALALLLPREQRWSLLGRVAKGFPWIAGASLLLLAASGALNALYNTPARSPGVFAPEVLTRLPFGKAYVAALLVKMGLTVAILAATVALAAVLRRIYLRPLPVRGGAGNTSSAGADPERPVRWLALANLVLGLLTFANVVVLGYLHIIVHVGGALGSP